MPTYHFVLSQTPQTTTEHQVFVLMPDQGKLFYDWMQNGACFASDGKTVV